MVIRQVDCVFRLKLIAAGKVLKFDQTLQQQMIKHGSTVLAMVLPSVGNDSSNAVSAFRTFSYECEFLEIISIIFIYQGR